MAFPVAGYIADASRTVAEMKAALEDWLAATKALAGASAETTITISTDVAVPSLAVHSVDTEAAAATDNLTTLGTANIADGGTVMIRCASAARVVTVKHNTGGAGKISLVGAVDVVLNSTRKWLMLKRTGADWEEVARFGFPAKIPYANASAVTGTGDAVIVTTVDPAPQAWEEGLEIDFVAEATNTVTNPTLNWNSMGDKTMTDLAGGTLPQGIISVGQKYRGVYDGTALRLDIDPTVAKLGQSQAWSAGQTPFGNSLTDAATITWNATTQGQSVDVTPTAARTFAAPTNLVNKRWYYLEVIQSSAFTHIWDTAFKWNGGQTNAPVAFTGRLFISFKSDGTNLREVGRSYTV